MRLRCCSYLTTHHVSDLQDRPQKSSLSLEKYAEDQLNLNTNGINPYIIENMILINYAQLMLCGACFNDKQYVRFSF